MDWAYGDQGIKYAYTMEMRPGSDGGGMVVPKEEILEQALEMYAFHVSAARDIMAEFGNYEDTSYQPSIFCIFLKAEINPLHIRENFVTLLLYFRSSLIV